jgi:asparagine synthase (glutamine-hydrolysing)
MRKHVKVVLSGDGGDEMFGGYDRFAHADLAAAVGALPAWLLDWGEAIATGFRRVLPDRSRQARRLLRAARGTEDERLLSLMSIHQVEHLPLMLDDDAAARTREFVPGFPAPRAAPPRTRGGERLMDETIRTDLPGDYLKKVDVASGAHGLEVRLPFLGSQVLDLSARIPRPLKYSLTSNKLLLRRLADRHLPRPVARKPKQGFGIPLDTWLGGAGRHAVASMLREPGAPIRSLMRPGYIESVTDAFANGTADPAERSRFAVYQGVYYLWSLDTWLRQWRPST